MMLLLYLKRYIEHKRIHYDVRETEVPYEYPIMWKHDNQIHIKMYVAVLYRISEVDACPKVLSL